MTPPQQNYLDSPTYWFAILEIARDHQDFEKAAEAIRELRRLGVDVRFKPQGSKGGFDARIRFGGGTVKGPKK